MENHKVNSNEMLLNEADFMLAVLQTYEDIAYLKEKHRTLYSDKMQLHMLNQLVKLESFIDENKVDWEQLYFSCLEMYFTEVQVSAIKSVISQILHRMGEIDYKNLYKSFRYLKSCTSNLYQSVIDNINSNYCGASRLSPSVATADKLYAYYSDCKRLVIEYAEANLIDLTEVQNASLQKNLTNAIFFYYVLEREIFEKNLDLDEVVRFVNDKENLHKLEELDVSIVSFQNKGGDERIDFLSETVVKQLKDVCCSYTTKRLAVDFFDSCFWNELKKEKIFWDDNAKYNGRRLFNSFLRGVIQAFVDSDVAVEYSWRWSNFGLVKVDESGNKRPVKLTKKIASYAYDLLGYVMWNAIKRTNESDKRNIYDLIVPSQAKVDFVKARLKGANDGYIIMEEDTCNGFKLKIAIEAEVIREIPFNLLF